MTDFFKHLKIRYADNPFLISYLVLFLTILAITLLVASKLTAILVAVFLLTFLTLVLNFHFYRANEELHVQQQQKLQAYLSLYNLIDFRLPPPYMTSWAATPELALAIYESIKKRKPQIIVELGSGITSLICGYAMDQNGIGALYSFDHEKNYCDKTKEMLSLHEINQQVHISYAPLKSQNINGKSCIWYDCSEADYPKSIDLLIIDGPPLETQDNARYPALPYFIENLSESATVILHDAFRKDEKNIVDEWIANHPDFKKETIYSEKGIVILKRSIQSA